MLLLVVTVQGQALVRGTVSTTPSLARLHVGFNDI
jgi:hypothetical protein